MKEIYKWYYRCPCGCRRIRSETGDIERWIIETTARLGSRGFAGMMLRNPKTDKKNFIFNLN